MQTELTLNKAVAALVGVAMAAGLAFTFAAERAHAVTLSELIELFIALDIIPSDKAEEARAVLANQGGETPSTPSTPAAGASCSYNFTMNLKAGSTGAEVMNLQKFLNSDAATVVAATGAGSKGMETSYFGPATAAAVAKFQEKYAAEILTPLGLTKGTGFFGASTRAKANAVCAAGGPATPPPPPATPGDDDDDATDDDDADLSGGEADLGDLEALNSPSNEDVQAGDEDVKVYGFKFDVDDADVEINRVDARFQIKTVSSGESDDPWDYIETLSLMNEDGDVLAEVDAGDEDVWDDQTGAGVAGYAGEVYEVRFSNIDDAVFEEGEEAKLYIAVTMQGNIDGDDLPAAGQDIVVWIANEGVRATDGAGLDQYTGDADNSPTESKKFTVEEEGEGEELKVALDSSNPDSSTIKVDEDNETDDVTVLVFTLEAEENDIEVTSLPVFWNISTNEQFADLVSDVRLEVDGTTFDDFTTASGTDYTATTTFDIDSGDLVIEADEKVTVKVIVDFNKLTGNYANGATIKASLRDSEVDAIDAEGADAIAAADLTGAAAGETHTLQSSGIFAEIVSTDKDTKSNGTVDDSVGEFTIKFEVTAFEDTYYISATNTAAFDVDVLQAGTASTTAVASVAVSSTATKETNSYRIDEGETETFTLTVTFEPNYAANYSAQLVSIDFGDLASAPLNQTAHTVAPAEDFETDPVYINA